MAQLDPHATYRILLPTLVWVLLTPGQSSSAEAQSPREATDTKVEQFFRQGDYSTRRHRL